MSASEGGAWSALVTGGVSGIGAAVVERLVSAGGQVIVVDLASPSEPIDGVAYVQGSSDDETVLEHATRLARDAAPLTTFVACAGVSRPGPSMTYSTADWQQLIDVDLSAIFVGARIAARAMTHGGSIIAIGSVHAHLGFGGRAAYSAAKAGVLGMSRSLAIEWAPLGIRVNTVSPGYVATDLVSRNLQSGALDETTLLNRIPAKRLGTPAEVAEVVWFLASPQAAYITGVDILIDGGLAAFGLALHS